MRNLCLDKFAQISEKADEDRWNELIKVIVESNF